MFGNTSFAEVPFSSIPAAVGGGSFQVAWARNANVLLDGDSIMQKNTAGQKIGVQMVSATDGSAFTGAVTVSVTGDAGTQATGSVGSGACTHEGNGYHTYAPAQAETNYDLIAFTFTGTGAVPSTVQVYTSFDANVTKLLGTAWLTPTTAGTPDVNTKTITDGIITAAKLAADAITAAKLAADVATEIQSGLATAAGVADVQTDVDDLQTRLPAALIGGRMDSSVEALAGGVITDAAFAANAILDTAIDASVGVEIADAVGNVGPVQDILTRVKGISPVNGTIGTTGNTTTTLHLMGLAYADDAINSMMLVIQDVSTGLYYARWIEDFANTGDLATVATLPFTPQASTDLYWILPIRSDVTGGSGLDAAGVRAALGMSSANLETLLTAIDDFLDTEIAAIKAKTDNLPSDPADASDVAALLATITGYIDTEVASILAAVDTEVAAIKAKTDNLPASPANEATLTTIAAYVDTEVAAILAAVDTEIASIKAKTDNLPTDPADASDIAASFASIASTLSTLAAYVDTEVAAIKAKTDSLTFTVAGKVDSNITHVNETEVTGTGGSGDEWGPI